jgi:hypothetical protein
MVNSRISVVISRKLGAGGWHDAGCPPLLRVDGTGFDDSAELLGRREELVAFDGCGGVGVRHWQKH